MVDRGFIGCTAIDEHNRMVAPRAAAWRGSLHGSSMDKIIHAPTALGAMSHHGASALDDSFVDGFWSVVYNASGSFHGSFLTENGRIEDRALRSDVLES